MPHGLGVPRKHPDTPTARDDLAATLNRQGHLAGARAHQEVVLDANRRLLGKEHPNTLTARDNLEAILKAQGSFGQHS